MLLRTRRGDVHYDPQYAKLQDGQGRPINAPLHLPQYLNSYLHMIGCKNPAHKSPYPNLVYVVLGYGCNHSCEYCMQKEFTRKSLPDDAAAFLTRVRKNKALFSEVDHVLFWGGEPLVYFEQLREIVLCLRRENLIRSSCKFVLNSNGTLLTPEIAAFFKEYDIRLIVSHDGPGQGARCHDPFGPAHPVSREAILRIGSADDGNLIVTSTMHRGNPSRRELLRYFGNIFKSNFSFPLYAFGLYYVTDTSLPANPYLASPLQSMVRNIAEYAGGVAERFFDFHLLLSKYSFRLACQHHNILETFESNYDVCNAKRLRMNLDGEITALHVGDFSPRYVMGTIDNLMDLHLPAGEFMGGSEKIRERCANCPVLPLCAGGECYIAPHLSDTDCLSKFTFYLPIWVYATSVYMLKAPITGVEIDGDFRHKELLAQFLASDEYQAIASA